MLAQGQLPHLRIIKKEIDDFASPRRGDTPPPPTRSREAHGARIGRQLADVSAAIAGARTRGSRGAAVTVRGADLERVAESLSDKKTNVRVLAQTPTGEIVIGTADGLVALERKVREYLTKTTPKGNPRNLPLINRIESVRIATVGDLSFGEIAADEIGDNDRAVVELWFERSSSAGDDWQTGFDALKESGQLLEMGRYLGYDREVVLVSVQGEVLKKLPLQFSDLAEMHLAPNVEVRSRIDTAYEQQLPETEIGRAPSVTLAVHDTGVDTLHPLLLPVLRAADSVVPGASEIDRDGHGTKMAGLAVFGDLADQLASGALEPAGSLVSIHFLDQGDNDEVLWAERSRATVELAEARAESDRVIHTFSWGAENPREHEPTAWSAALDRLAWNGGLGRLIVVAAGNVRLVDPADYPALNLGSPLTQPAQGWNVVTVGGVTLLDQLSSDDVRLGMASPVAARGQLSPHSRVGPARLDPHKPDVVAEAGNSAPDGTNANANATGLTLVTTGLRSVRGRELERTAMTSAAAALTSNALARIWGAYPDLRPATVRALLAHGSMLPAELVGQIVDSTDLRRSAGLGLINVERSVSSALNRPVLVFEGSLVPRRTDLEKKVHREVVYIELPWPAPELLDVADDAVVLQVTLSYFLEPSEALRRSRYGGVRLRWDMQGPNESVDLFKARVNKLAREPDYKTASASYAWEVGADNRSHSTLQRDFTVTSGSGLGGSRLLAVYPVLGWWDGRPQYDGATVPFSVVASVEATQSVDLYSPIEVDLDLANEVVI